jgi:predicted nuclease of predicted toxin-antitoxin system
LHLDENVDPAVADQLRRRGIDVTTTQSAGLLQAPDDGQLAYAVGEGRVLFTQDSDLLRMHSLGIAHSGIIYCKQSTRTLGQIVRGLSLICEVMTSEEMVDHLEYLPK